MSGKCASSIRCTWRSGRILECVLIEEACSLKFLVRERDTLPAIAGPEPAVNAGLTGLLRIRPAESSNKTSSMLLIRNRQENAIVDRNRAGEERGCAGAHDCHAARAARPSLTH